MPDGSNLWDAMQCVDVIGQWSVLMIPVFIIGVVKLIRWRTYDE